MTEHFSDAETVASSTALRLGIDNTPSALVRLNLQFTASKLEQVRALLGQPMHIDSWYRCPKLNAAVGGAQTSAHMSGFAVDFTCAAFGTPLDIVQCIIASGIKFDQLIQEGRWVHISFAPAMRQQTLTAHFSPHGTTYTQGA